MTTIREKMKNGMLYVDIGEGLDEERQQCKELCFDYNNTRPTDLKTRETILKQLLGSAGENIWFEPPIHMAYGKHVHIGNDFYANFNLTLVDDGEIFIGNNVMIAPNVTITPTGHPIRPDLRLKGTQFSIPVKIGNNVWIGCNVVILPGITIGDNSVIGSGSVVTHDIPENVVAFGNPCRVIRKINDHDQEFYFKNRKIEGKI